MQTIETGPDATFKFSIESRDPRTAARAGVLTTPRGKVLTPVYCPVGTVATVKTLDPAELEEAGAMMLLANTYHLMLRPGADRVERLGGLHPFMGWPRPIMTDSGGFQAFSLGFAREHGVGKIGGVFPDESGRPPQGTYRTGTNLGRLATIDEDGVTFRSHIDGSLHRLTPEISIALQQKLGADLIVAFDECTSPMSDHEYTRRAMERTHRWALRCLEAHRNGGHRPQALLGIIQGGAYEDLRRESTRVIGSLPFDAFCVGGSLGKSKADMHQVLEWSVPDLPDQSFRHLLGIGDVDDVFEAVARGIDSFDCVIPTRFARHGTLLVGPPLGNPRNRFRLNIWNAQYADDSGPVDPTCSCPLCRRFSRAYLRHLFQAEEGLGHRLASLHNVWFTQEMMRQIRSAILAGRFLELQAAWLSGG
jgi:queuine tRNA-ribosyltransferase